MTSIHAQLNSDAKPSQANAPLRPGKAGGEDSAAPRGDRHAESAFAGLLGSLSVPSLPQVAEASPERMFDAADAARGGARGDRIGVMASEQRSADLSASDPRQSVETRAEAATRNAESASAKGETRLQPASGLREARGASAFAERANVRAVPASRSDSAGGKVSIESAANSASRAAGGSAGDARPSAAASLPSPGVPASSGAAPVVDVRGAEPKGTTAHHIGRALASGGTSGAESARSVAQVVGDDRSAASRDARGGAAAKAKEGQQPEKPNDARAAELPEKFRSLVRAIRFGSGAGESSSARFRLDPPELGRLLVDVRMEDGKLRVHLKAESEEALSRISQRMGDLRSALQLHGVSIDQVEMEVDPRLADRGEDPLDFLGRRDQPPAFAGSSERRAEARSEFGGASALLGEVRQGIEVGEEQHTELGAERGLDVRA